jgi:hypothetical protein
VLGPSGLAYVAVTKRLGVPEASILVGRVSNVVSRARR